MANFLCNFFQKENVISLLRSWVIKVPFLKKLAKTYRIPCLVLCQSSPFVLVKWICSGSFLTISLKESIHSFAQQAQNTQIWFDHMWKGGTELYTHTEFSRMKKDSLCIRIQNNGATYYLMTCYYDEIVITTCFVDLFELINYLKTLPIDILVLNNLAGYLNPIQTLEAIVKIKTTTQAKFSYRVHDFQSFCPRMHMVKSDNTFCDCRELSQCIPCMTKEDAENIQDAVFLQLAWQKVLEHYVDEIIVFSLSTQEILERFYPFVKSKILVVPHYSVPLRKVHIETHSGINIGILGSIGTLKGSEVVDSMARCLDDFSQCSLVIIGDYFGKELKKVKILGRYEKNNLPDILEDEHIDIIFIPSILPETFSYTTAEAMSMGIPVACFNLGAPAERVAQYEKGLVVDVMDGEYAFKKLVEFYMSLHS